ncbi:uncharacterized protein N7529_009634 [Penicillium soppii]|jgi:hypothetical protein|uniref:uncharacterized protein n=1 Tax=Penicillium soppii TaxID=69789 RepID=UPI002548BC3E|nr:uncharacterized protein N7529_009634 [Penicillium soppii]KAJ5855690.1 hypothetical protein N7529_009634 [Penicillium soppii]
MSTQSPHPPTPKGSRNNRRPQKKTMTPQAQKPGLLSTPPSSPPGNMSPAIQAVPSNNSTNKQSQQTSRSMKKSRDNRASPATHNGYYSNGHQNNGYANGYQNGYRNAPNHASVTSPQMKESAAYAGPTFHASPAPSSLPMPKFLPKSAPDADLVPPLETDSDSADLSPSEQETTPSRRRSRISNVNQEPQPTTALDFMFQAAKKAKERNSTSSTDVSRIRSPQTEPVARHNSGGMGTVDMDNSRYSPIGPSFATSYQDRMAALRPSSVPQSTEISDAERKAKTEQLKDLLLNPRPQKPPSAAPYSPGNAGGFGNFEPRQPGSFDRHSPNFPPFATPSRASSGPPMAHHSNPFGNPPPQSNPHLRNPHLFAKPGSPLREVNPAPYQFPSRGTVSNGSSPGPYHQYRQSPNPLYPGPAFHSTNSPSPLPSRSMDTQQIENDIRRVLKLDASTTFA